jgi:hypothetical protein
VCALFARGGAAAGFEVRHYRGSLRDLWRGSPARRAWAVAHALEASDLACVAPVAFLEWKRFGLALRSALVVRAEPAAIPRAVARGGDAHGDLLARLAEAGFDARRLDASGIALSERAGRTLAHVAAPEQLRFPARRWRLPTW